jgi:hypothetical protein
MNLEIAITDITPANRRVKMLKAIRVISKKLNVPVSVESKGKAHGQEPYLYDIQQELADEWIGYYSSILKKIYDTVIAALGLPRVDVETMRKSIDDSGPLRYRGKIVYNPETGQPISNRDFDNLIENIQKFLNRNTKDIAKQVLLDSVTIGKLLKRIARCSASADMEKLKLDGLKYRGKTFDWIRDDFKNLAHVMGESFTRSEMARYQVATDYVAQLVTRTNDNIRNEIKDTVLKGIREHRTKGQVSQDLFNRLGSMNRDWRRIADTEIVNTSNLAGILEDVHNAPEGEKVYFKRYELPGCCDKCARINGKVVLWSNAPLADDHIKDEHADIAIWEGKPQDKKMTTVVPGTMHPNCYSDDTEVMTDHGWKFFKDLSDDDKIMSLNPETREIDFLPFTNRTAYRYNGKMIQFIGRNYNLSVTPDHTMLFVSQKGYYREAAARDLLDKRYYRLPRAVGRWEKADLHDMVTFGDLMISKKQYFRLWAWYLAEGSGRTRDKNSHEAKIAQKVPGNIIRDLPELKTVLHEYSDSVCLYGQYAGPFKEMFGVYADKKYIPQFIKDSSAENIRGFLDAFSLADGTKRTRKAHGKSYSDSRKEQYVRTSSKEMADDLCELIVKAGWMPSVSILKQAGETIHFDNGDYVINTDCYNINICKSKFRCFGNDTQPGHKRWHEPVEVDYHGVVYDVELEKWHFLLVKRNGKCAWSGNCRGGWVRWGGKRADAMGAKIRGKIEAWDKAVKKARDEYRDKGIDNPNDQTKGYTDRINELYQSYLGA